MINLAIPFTKNKQFGFKDTTMWNAETLIHWIEFFIILKYILSFQLLTRVLAIPLIA